MDSRLRGNDISCLQHCFNLSFLSMNKSRVSSSSGPVFYFSNPQPATCNRQRIYPPLTFILSPQAVHYPYLYHIIRSRYILIFEENYGRFVALSSLLTPNFNALLNPIQGLLRKPRLLLTPNSLPDFFSTVFYEKISGIPAS